MFKKARLLDAYRVPGFRPLRTVLTEDDPDVRIVILERRQKKSPYALCAGIAKWLSGIES
jgi:hypothetical protein